MTDSTLSLLIWLRHKLIFSPLPLYTTFIAAGALYCEGSASMPVAGLTCCVVGRKRGGGVTSVSD